MNRSSKESPEIVRAAETLESELVHLETLSRAVRKITLNSEKNIARALTELNEALALPERLAEGLRGVAIAMSNMQSRQDAALLPLAECAAAIRARSVRLGAHMGSFGELGVRARELVELLQKHGTDPGSVAGDVEDRLAAIANDARALASAATEDDFPDVAREADALRQRVSALRGRIAKS
ncbi:MAG TPA: hypothetical protein VHE30_30655 [Polyangiaceae bacterium]|nr:hypothetical protein [Polyangiaceae bacterium]